MHLSISSRLHYMERGLAWRRVNRFLLYVMEDSVLTRSAIALRLDALFHIQDERHQETEEGFCTLNEI